MPFSLISMLIFNDLSACGNTYIITNQTIHMIEMKEEVRQTENSHQKHIAFIHPDLGIGGAEQLIVNLGLAAIRSGYKPHIYTPYHHKSFPETHDGTITIHEHGSFFGLIPDTIFGKFKGLLAYIRCLLCCIYLVTYSDIQYDVIVADQVSVVLPLLRLFGFKTIFYCHYPDKLLSGKSHNIFKKIYRFVIDTIEEVSLLFSHKIYVNSEFTKKVFYDNFKIMRSRKVQVEVLYPALDFSQFDQTISRSPQIEKVQAQINGKYFFSLNRYERKKNINLAIQAFALLVKQNDGESWKGVKLMIAGGYDLKVAENTQHLQELKELAQDKGVSEKVIFLTSISNDQRKYLLKNCLAVLYTPQNQHFGIVPCEAMYCSVPVIAHNSGGPKESVREGCGYLCSSEPSQWTEKMKYIFEMKKGSSKMDKGKEKMIERFGLQMFSRQFKQGIDQVKAKRMNL